MKKLFLKCECGCGGLYLSYSRAWGLEIAHLHRNPSSGWRDRFRLALACLQGKPYSDQTILNEQGIADLAEYLFEVQNTDHAKKDHDDLIKTIVGHLFSAGHDSDAVDAVEGIIKWAKSPYCGRKALNDLVDKLNKI